MERKITKKLVAILMIITILMTDFYVLGSNLVTYASQINSETNNSNVEFSVYFKKEDKRVDSVESSIKNDNLKLYAEIKVKNEGYLKEGTTIELLNSNFNIITSNIGKVEDNKVVLNQISTGETKEIELGIKPISSNKIEKDMLSQISTVKLSGKYIYSQDDSGEEILTEKAVSVNFIPDEATQAELETNIITNRVLLVGETNKRIVQVSIKSRLSDNQYPVKQTTLNVDIPKLGEQIPEVSVLSIGKLATNGLSKIEETEYTVNDGKLQITLKNEADENNKISWLKDACDEIVVTYVYPEDVDASVVEVNTESEIKLHNSGNTYTAKYTKGIENQEPNSIIMGKTEITKELYKGSIYANIETQYNTKTTIVIGNAEVAEEIVVKENADVFGIEEKELEANTKYKTTEIDLNKILEILGQNGIIEIKNGDITTTINKDSKVNENGKVVINHENSTKEIEIKTSKPEKAGIIEIEHTKVIAENNYTREELKKANELNSTSTVIGNKAEEKVVENTTKPASLELKETITKAELTIENNKQTLSTTEENEVMLGITLITEGLQYDLYKNPEITIQLPTDVKNVEFVEEPSKINADEFEIVSKQYDSINKTIKLNIKGQQTKYADSSTTQAYIQLNLKITLEQLAITHNDEITMKYLNENASQYYNDGIAKKEIEISGPSKVITKFNLSSNDNTSLTETLIQQVKNSATSSNLEFELGLVNNKDSNISNIRILGKLPTIGNVITEQDENSLETTLRNINAQNATIYYTENSSATEDIEDSLNGWTQEFLTNAKLFLIKLDNMNKGDNYTANIVVQLPKQIQQNTASYTEYKVIYDTENEKDVKESSRKIGLISSLVATIKTEITAQVGQEKLSDGGKVKEGEVIKYTATVINKGNESLRDVQLKANVPEGTVLVKPIEATNNEDDENYNQSEEDNGYKDGYVYAKNAYYEEITDSERIEKITSTTILELKVGEEAKIEYEVRVNKGTSGTEIKNNSTATYDGSNVQSTEFTNIVKESNIRVTIKRTIDESIQLVAGGTTRYKVYVENMSDSTIKDLNLQILSNAFNIERIENDNIYLYGDEIPQKLNILEIKANEIMNFSIYGSIANNANELNTTAIVFDSNGEKYRANLVSETLPYTDASITLTSPQNGQYVKQGDTVEYIITVSNTGDIEEQITIDDVIPSYLQIQSISIIDNTNTETFIEISSNHICKDIIMKPNESAQVKIISKVGYIPELYHGKVTTNYAVVKVFDINKNSSERVAHVLQSNLVQDSVENIINGYVWFDENENGKIDVNEKSLADINVKIFDLSSNGYLLDEHGGVVEVNTNSEGEYTFKNIKNGSYLIIAECDGKYKTAKIRIENLTGNIFNVNIGLKKNTGDTENPDNPVNPDTPNTPESPEEPSQNPEKPENPTMPEEDKKTISGLAWLDTNRNGKKDVDEVTMSGIKVKIYDVITKNYLVDTKGNIVEAITDNDGKYIFNDIEKGTYILVFEYDTEKYKPTIYLAEGVDTTLNSKVVLKKITVNEQEISTAVTDLINVQNDIQNVNIGLKENLVFDLELNKYISKIVVQTSKETKTYDYENKTFGKVEIHRKQISGANVILEYTITVKNTGEISGYAKNIVDYLPNGLTFSSELNTDWYLSEGNLYTKSLENVQLKPGEEKEVKLILTKIMTGDNVGLINNRAEIYQDYNKYGESDVDSTPNNQIQNEDDFGTVDVIIEIATGGEKMAYTVLLMTNIILIGIAIKLMIKNKIIRIPSKKGRR